MTWFYKDKEFLSEDIKEYQGFVYCITFTDNNKKYIGKKFFYSTKSKIVKGKKKKIKLESDWKDYYSSSKYLKEQ